MSAVATIEEIPGGAGRQTRTAIIVTEIPYQVNKAQLIEKIAELVKDQRINGISGEKGFFFCAPFFSPGAISM